MIYRIQCLLLILFCTFSSPISAQYETEVYTLDNGLTVYLNEEPEAPAVTGCVAVKSGAKYDPPEATGIAHYLEHMLFKGTKTLGTIDYAAESVWLDSIEYQYEVLHSVQESSKRDSLYQIINTLSLEAGKYAIPNEMDKILDKMGATGVNAFTGMEQNAYYNRFPANEMEKWLRLYAHRFQNPVFRLFQSELETVFEEKNMYLDQFETVLIESFFKQFYQEHPYGQQTVLGKADHIKNPSLSEMQNFYDRYYVAGNMALILSGPFDSQAVKPLINRYFSDLPSGSAPSFDPPEEPGIDGRQVHTERLTPVRAGLIGFRTVPVNHPDKAALDVFHALLTNPNGTGYLDKLGKENELLYAMALNDMRLDYGSTVFLFVPKLLFQSFRKAENLVLDEITRLQKGDFEESELEAIKQNLIKKSELSLENQSSRINKLMQVFFFDKSWQDIRSYPEKIARISKDDIISVAKRYYGEDYFLFRSRMGFPDKSKLDKPGYDPVKPLQPEAQSEFAKKLENTPSGKIQPDFIDLNKDMSISDHSDYTLYHTENPYNSIFNLSLRFQKGKLEQPACSQLASYLNESGSKSHPGTALATALQNNGCSMSVYADDQYFNIVLDGPDDHLDTCLSLINGLIKAPAENKDALKNLVKMRRLEARYEKRKPSIIAEALIEYAMYDSLSSYLHRLDKKAVRKLDYPDMTRLVSELKTASLSVHYSGSLKAETISEYIKDKLSELKPEKAGYKPLIPAGKTYKEPVVYFVNDKNARQSNIYFYIPGTTDSERSRVMAKAFNKYFGLGMSSVVFQEIRELRSMAYTAYAMYRPHPYKDQPGYFKGYIGTQADKTGEAIRVFDSLLVNMPQKPGRINGIQKSLMQSVNMENPGFRKISYLAQAWINQGYKHDPRKYRYNLYDDVSMESINVFHTTHLRQSPMVIAIVGNSDLIDMNALKAYGRLIELETDEIMN
jgi:predicted Zn-dependent peptidase